MNKTLWVKEIAIAIATQSPTPAVLNLEFLKYSGIIPSGWELVQPPVQTAATTQLIFNSGVTLLSQPNRIVWGQPVDGQPLEQLSVAAIAQKYVNVLPQMNYRAVSTHAVGYVPFTTDAESDCYLFATLLRPGTWQTIEEAKAQAALQLTYDLGGVQFNLNIRTMPLESAQQKIHTVLFTANFNHPISGDAQSDRLKSVSQAIEHWQADLDLYQRVIKTQFLQEGDRSTPPMPPSNPAKENHVEDNHSESMASKPTGLQVSVTPLP
jgi:hypothetical protein